ncbi:MAG TPA: hypothetical protein DDX98_10375 [Bacteroidales bacterium]|mgnify:CR=1 FL=1|jgi:hypothetical protein|nr:hypothetical protein [Bacteroidales bacterium]
MKVRVVVSIVLILAGALVHSIAGELTDIRALLDSSIPDNYKSELRFAWYLVAIDFFVSGSYLLILLVRRKLEANRLLINFIALRFLLYGLAIMVTLIVTMPSLLLDVPQWILLIAIGTLLGWGKFAKAKAQYQLR